MMETGFIPEGATGSVAPKEWDGPAPAWVARNGYGLRPVPYAGLEADLRPRRYIPRGAYQLRRLPYGGPRGRAEGFEASATATGCTHSLRKPMSIPDSQGRPLATRRPFQKGHPGGRPTMNQDPFGAEDAR